MGFVERSEPLWQEFAEIVGGEGLEIYDLEVAARSVIRVTLAKPMLGKISSGKATSALDGSSPAKMASESTSIEEEPVDTHLQAAGSYEPAEDSDEAESDFSDLEETDEEVSGDESLEESESLGTTESTNVASTNVTSGDCSRVCRRLMAFCLTEGARLGVGAEPEFDVSSPGLDRSLRLPEHFEGAVGTVIRCIPRTEAAWTEVNGKPLVGVLRGELELFEGGRVHIREERTKALVVAPLEAIKRANVEFIPDMNRAG